MWTEFAFSPYSKDKDSDSAILAGAVVDRKKWPTSAKPPSHP
jgi:hypothetical protein